MVKHDFLNLKSCNDDKEGLKKTLMEGKEKDAWVLGRLKTGKARNKTVNQVAWNTLKT